MISTKLRQLRAERNLHLAELAKKSGLTVRRIKAYENGVRPIPLSDLESLAAAIGVEADSFLEYHGPVGEWEIEPGIRRPIPKTSFRHPPVRRAACCTNRSYAWR